MNETTTVLDYVDVEGFKVRPWGIDALSKLSPHLEKIVDGLKRRGVSVKDLKDGKGLDGIVFAILPEAPDILALTLSVPREEVAEFPPNKAMKLVLAIVQINMVYLKNWFGPLAEVSRKVAGLSRSSTSSSTEGTVKPTSSAGTASPR